MTPAQQLRELQRMNLLTMPNATLEFPDVVVFIYQFGQRALSIHSDGALLKAADRIEHAATIPPVFRNNGWAAIALKVRFNAGALTVSNFTSGSQYILSSASGAGELRYVVKPDLSSSATGIDTIQGALKVAAELTPSRGNVLVQIGGAFTDVAVSTGKAIGRAAGAAVRPVAIPLVILALSIGLVIFLARRQS